MLALPAAGARPSPAAQTAATGDGRSAPGAAARPDEPRLSTNPAVTELVARAERLLAAGQAEQAWHLLDARVGEFAGDPLFDYALGLAALDSGHPGQAIFALERVLMLRPDFLPARAEIARAYYMVREHENARREFTTVAAQRIPEQARRTIGAYLDAIARADEPGGRVVALRAEIETGYDSNVNFGSASGQWLLADGTGVTPLPSSRPRPSALLAGAVALDVAAPLSKRVEWTAGARASGRFFPNVSEFDQQQFDASTGLALREGCHRWSALALLQHLRLDDAAYRNAGGAALQWQCEVDERTLIGATLQAFRLDYPGSAHRDARRTALGVNAARLLATTGRPILIGSLAIGEESSRRGFENLAHDFVSVRAGMVARVAPSWRASASLAWERREFGAAEPLFGVVREDRQTEVRIEFERRVDEQTAVVPYLVGTRNKSTLSPNDFRRLQAGVLVRRRF